MRTALSVVDASTRRAAFVATSLTVPLVLVVAFALAPRHDKAPANATPTALAPTALAPISVAPGLADEASVAACTRVISELPVQLDGLDPRPVDAERAVAWGPDPAVILRCGAARPADLVPGSSAVGVYVAGENGQQVAWLPQGDPDSPSTITAVDRSVYIEISSRGGSHLPALSQAISTALPPLCRLQSLSGPSVPDRELCTNRK